jgi:cardiolipin synthase
LAVRQQIAHLRRWSSVPPARFVGGNQVDLLQGGDELFPRMLQAIEAARRDIWLATYIFHDDPAANRIAQALVAAAGRGLAVHVVVDGFGSLANLPRLRALFEGSGVQLEVFRPLDRWYAWFVCDGEVAFVGGINLIDDRCDLRHGWTDAPRLDFAVAVRGPLAAAAHAATRAMWVRAHLWRRWKHEVRRLARSRHKVDQATALVHALRGTTAASGEPPDSTPMQAAFLMRDNLRQRRAIEHSYIGAIRSAKVRVDIAVPYFYPGRAFRRALRAAARRGVRVRLLLQGKVDYRIAALAARALYDELRAYGVEIHEYTPAFLHAKVALVDDHWATVGSSNIDPLSLLLNLEANVVVRDADFCAALAARFEEAFAVATQVTGEPQGKGWRSWLHRGGVAWLAHLYLRVAGITGRY